MRVAIYSRVSTDRQETENQLIEMREYCKRQGYEITHEYVDFDVSASKTPLWERKQGKLLLKGIQNREFDKVICWALDRLCREGEDATRDYLSLLKTYGISFYSYKEPYLSTENELVRSILIATLAWVAKQEALRQSERVKAGINRMRKEITEQGYYYSLRHRKKIARIGRKPTYTQEQEVRMQELWAQYPKPSYNKIAREVGLNVGIVYRYLLTKTRNSTDEGNANSNPIKSHVPTNENLQQRYRCN